MKVTKHFYPASISIGSTSDHLSIFVQNWPLSMESIALGDSDHSFILKSFL